MNLFLIPIILSALSIACFANDSTIFPHQFRTITADGNNIWHRTWGAAGVFLQRLTIQNTSPEPAYPNSRYISNTLFNQNDTSLPAEHAQSSFLWAWAQFILSDMVSFSEAIPLEPFDIIIPTPEPLCISGELKKDTIFYNRTEYIVFRESKRQQINKASSFIDGSMIYGNNPIQTGYLRQNNGSGKLKTVTMADLVEYDGNFIALNNLTTKAFQVLFIKEHNYWCDIISSLKPELSADQIFDVARAIIIGEIQSITYNEFLPALLGPSPLPPYSGYDPSINATLTNEFSLCFEMVTLTLTSSDSIDISSDQSCLFNDHLLKAVFESLYNTHSEKIDVFIIDKLRNQSLAITNTTYDPAAVLLQRSRDHQIPSYNELRIAMGLEAIDKISSVCSQPGIYSVLENIYKNYSAMEFLPLALAEDHIIGAPMGISMYKLLKQQFRLLREGDRFFYLSYLPHFMITMVERRTLHEIICTNSQIPPNALNADLFFNRPNNGKKSCNE